MRQIHIIIGILAGAIFFNGCEDVPVEANFEDMIDFTIYDYMVENAEQFSSFLAICEAGKIDKTLRAYNPDNLKYTLFLPTNEAVDRFIQQSDRFSSLNDLLADEAYVSTLSRFHVVNLDINADDFPFGALPEYTLTGDVLTVSFVVEEDTSYYVINNQAPVVLPNVEASNGWVHVVIEMLQPIVYTTHDWLSQNGGYSIFLEAAEATGFSDLLDLNVKDEEETRRPFTLFVEHDSVFQRNGINSFDDLAMKVSPDDPDYTDAENPLHNFVGYHMLGEAYFLDDFVDISTNYTTHSDVPLNVNGTGLDILINKGKMVFDTIINGVDTTIIDYVKFYYDDSNILTQSGSIHFIDQVMVRVRPSRQIQTFQFGEEPLFNEYRQEPGEYLVDDHDALEYITWEGADLVYVKEANENYPTWSQDYITLNGDFRVTYQLPQIVQGNYNVYMRAESFSSLNAVVEVYIDGKKFGGLVDLTTGGTSNNPYQQILLGSINFVKYEEHLIEVRSLIPGVFNWDHIRFEPY